VITVKDPLDAISTSFFLPGVIVGSGIGQLVVTVPPGLESGDYDVAVTLEDAMGNIVRLPIRAP